MAQVSATLTTDEISAYEAFCAKHGIIDSHTHDGVANANFIANYFLNIWKEDITEQNLNTAWEQIRPHLKFYAPHQQEYEKLHVSLTAEEQAAFREWKGERGLKDTHKNAVAILSWIKAHGFRVTKENLQLAVGQNRVQPFLEWDESKTTPPKGPDARQHKDDGKPFLGENLNEPRWKRIQRERQETEARDAASRPSASSVALAAVREAKQRAEGLTGSSHSETNQLQRIFITTPGTSEINWPATLASRLQMQQQFNKHRAVARFIR
jgi:hypothetical protein